MAVISGADYLSLANEYASARDKHLAMKQDFFDAVYAIVLLNTIDPEVDLLGRFHGSYLVNSSQIDSSELFLAAIRTLQNHVIVRSGLGTVDAYLDNQGITVPRTFATLSALAGFTLSESNID